MTVEKILFLGDFFYDYENVPDDLLEIGKWIKDNGYSVILNLEGGIDCYLDQKIKKRGPNLSCSASTIEALKTLNVVGVTLANNHMLDYGEKSLLHTIKLLDDNGIQHTGAGTDINSALDPMSFEMEDHRKIIVFACGWDVEETVYATEKKPGCVPRDDALLMKVVKKHVRDDNAVIVCLHWGFEYNRLPMPIDIQLAHMLISNGAYAVVGGHPHVVQPKEKFLNKMIYYSLGNFYFSSRRNKFNKQFKNETIKNQSDYGVGIGMDIIKGQSEEITVVYSHENDRSYLKPQNDLILENLCDKIRNDKESYIIEAKKRKLNKNPILTGNKAADYTMLILRNIRFFVGRTKRKIMNIGDGI